MSVQTATGHFQLALEEATTKRIAAEQQVVHWSEQETQISAAIAAIKGILPANAFSTEPLAIKTRGPKKGAHKEATRAIPNLPEEFWTGLLTTTPAKMQEITDAAAAKLGITDQEIIATLKKRQANALGKLVEEKKIQDQGERQNRVYFLA